MIINRLSALLIGSISFCSMLSQDEVVLKNEISAGVYTPVVVEGMGPFHSDNWVLQTNYLGSNERSAGTAGFSLVYTRRCKDFSLGLFFGFSNRTIEEHQHAEVMSSDDSDAYLYRTIEYNLEYRQQQFSIAPFIRKVVPIGKLGVLFEAMIPLNFYGPTKQRYTETSLFFDAHQNQIDNATTNINWDYDGGFLTGIGLGSGVEWRFTKRLAAQLILSDFLMYSHFDADVDYSEESYYTDPSTGLPAPGSYAIKKSPFSASLKQFSLSNITARLNISFSF